MFVLWLLKMFLKIYSLNKLVFSSKKSFLLGALIGTINYNTVVYKAFECIVKKVYQYLNETFNVNVIL